MGNEMVDLRHVDLPLGNVIHQLEPTNFCGSFNTHFNLELDQVSLTSCLGSLSSIRISHKYKDRLFSDTALKRMSDRGHDGVGVNVFILLRGLHVELESGPDESIRHVEHGGVVVLS